MKNSEQATLRTYSFSSRDEWLKARKSYIGGSDAAAVLGMNPYKTNVKLWEEKTGISEPEDISDKPYVKYGHEAEEHLRELFRLDFPQYQVFYDPDTFLVNDKYPWAHASVDGLLRDQEGRLGILEIKTTNIMQSMQKEQWDDRIPDNYYLQVLHYMMVLEADFTVLKAQLKYEFKDSLFLQTRHYFIERSDVEEDIRILRDAEQKFWKDVVDKRRPAVILPDI
jgi:putative phage-type endonuclease